LEQRSGEAQPLDGIGRAFLEAAQDLVDGPWQMAAVPDFVFPYTRGERPTDLAQSLAITGALYRLALVDPAIDQLIVEVGHLMKPPTALQDRAIVQRVNDEMARQSTA
jgi:hypothetical protein